MKKGRSITLLSLICLVMAFLVVMTFIRFPVGVKNYNGVLGAIEKDYDIAGGTAYNLTLARDNTEEVEDINEVIIEDAGEFRVLKGLEKMLSDNGYDNVNCNFKGLS